MMKIIKQTQKQYIISNIKHLIHQDKLYLLEIIKKNNYYYYTSSGINLNLLNDKTINDIYNFMKTKI